MPFGESITMHFFFWTIPNFFKDKRPRCLQQQKNMQLKTSKTEGINFAKPQTALSYIYSFFVCFTNQCTSNHPELLSWSLRGCSNIPSLVEVLSYKVRQDRQFFSPIHLFLDEQTGSTIVKVSAESQTRFKCLVGHWLHGQIWRGDRNNVDFSRVETINRHKQTLLGTRKG